VAFSLGGRLPHGEGFPEYAVLVPGFRGCPVFLQFHMQSQYQNFFLPRIFLFSFWVAPILWMLEMPLLACNTACSYDLVALLLLSCSDTIKIRIPCFDKKQPLYFLDIISANDNRFSKFFHWHISHEILYDVWQRVPYHLSYVATLPCEIWKFKRTVFHNQPHCLLIVCFHKC